MKIEITGQTVEEIRDKVFALALVFGFENAPTQTVQHTIPDAAIHTPVEPAVNAKPKGKPGRKPVEKVEVQAPVDSAKPVETAVEKPVEKIVTEPTPLTADDAMEALKKVSGKHGIPAAREILLKFGAERLSAVKERDYPAFISECLKTAKLDKTATASV